MIRVPAQWAAWTVRLSWYCRTGHLHCLPPEVSGCWAEREKPMRGETPPVLLVSSTNTVDHSNELRPHARLITGDKDKERIEEGTGEHSGEGRR